MFQGCFMYAYVSSVYRNNVYCEIIVVFHENNDTVLILSIVIALEPWFLLSLFYSLLLYYHYIPLLSLLYSNFFFTLSEDKVVNGDRFPNAQNRKVSNSVFQKKSRRIKTYLTDSDSSLLIIQNSKFYISSLCLFVSFKHKRHPEI